MTSVSTDICRELFLSARVPSARAQKDVIFISERLSNAGKASDIKENTNGKSKYPE
jgi:hypothetical protein